MASDCGWMARDGHCGAAACDCGRRIFIPVGVRQDTTVRMGNDGHCGARVEADVALLNCRNPSTQCGGTDRSRFVVCHATAVAGICIGLSLVKQERAALSPERVEVTLPQCDHDVNIVAALDGVPGRIRPEE